MKKWYIMLAIAMLLLSGCGKQVESAEATTEESNTEELEPATTEALETVTLKDAEIGDIVQMGIYEQDGDTETEDPICWDVLDKDGDAVLLISHDVIAYQRFSDNHKCVIWEDSEIRTWLNQEFYAEASALGRRPSRAVLQKRKAIFTDLIIEEIPAMYPYSRHLPDGTERLPWMLRSTGMKDYTILVIGYDVGE